MRAVARLSLRGAKTYIFAVPLSLKYMLSNVNIVYERQNILCTCRYMKMLRLARTHFIINTRRVYYSMMYAISFYKRDVMNKVRSFSLEHILISERFKRGGKLAKGVISYMRAYRVEDEA